MSDLKPLIDSAAFWVSTDAVLRIFWSAFGAVMILVAVLLMVPVARWVGRVILDKPAQKNHPNENAK